MGHINTTDNSVGRVFALQAKCHRFDSYSVDLRFLSMRVVKLSGKPFKSGFKINTVKSTDYVHPITGKVCYHFIEDDSYVEIHRCRMATTEDETKAFMHLLSKKSHLDLETLSDDKLNAFNQIVNKYVI